MPIVKQINPETGLVEDRIFEQKGPYPGHSIEAAVDMIEYHVRRAGTVGEMKSIIGSIEIIKFSYSPKKGVGIYIEQGDFIGQVEPVSVELSDEDIYQLIDVKQLMKDARIKYGKANANLIDYEACELIKRYVTAKLCQRSAVIKGLVEEVYATAARGTVE